MTTVQILALLRGVEQVGERRWKARCPAHDDENPSLSIKQEPDGKTLLHCHAGCEKAAVVGAMGITLADLFPTRSGDDGPAEPVATYDYVDEEGRLLYQVCRFPPKDFCQRRPDGRGGWIWNLRGIRRVLYRLPEVVKATGGIIFVVEGEKDADRLATLGLTATTNPGGAGKWRREYADHLRGAHVVVLLDNDEPGRSHAQKVARSLHGIAADVKIVELPGLPEKGDVSDWLDGGHACRELLDLVRDAPAWTPVQGLGAVGAARDGDGGQLDDNGPPSLTDSGNSSRLIALHGRRLRHVHAWGVWLVWRDGRWTRDPREALTFELAKDVGGRLKREAASIEDKELADKTFKFGQQSLAKPRIEALVKLARGIPGVLIDHERLDADGWLLGVKGGVIDLRSGRFRQADPADLMTMQCPVAFDPDATCPRFERAMDEWFPDPAMRDYVHRVAGSALVGGQRDHVFVVHYGDGGNGKGTFVRALQRVVGPYSVEIHLSLLVETRHREHDTVRADLFRTRLAVASETARGARLDEASVKNLTGGDRVRARRMREDPWSFDPTHSLWLLTNELPAIRGQDAGIWRRIRVVKWVSSFTGTRADTRLDETLAAEAPGILNWLIRGCRPWQERGLDEPEAVIRDTAAYRESQDVLALFARDVGVVFRKGLAVSAARLQELLLTWVEQEGARRPANKDVGTWLTRHGARAARRLLGGKRLKYWEGVGVPGEDGEDGGTEDAVA